MDSRSEEAGLYAKQLVRQFGKSFVDVFSAAKITFIENIVAVAWLDGRISARKEQLAELRAKGGADEVQHSSCAGAARD